MLIRRTLREEMEQKLHKQTEKEIRAELETCTILQEIHVLVSDPKNWRSVVADKILTAVKEKGQEELWEDLDGREQEEVIALFAAHLLSIQTTWASWAFTYYIMSELKAAKAGYITYRQLEVRPGQIKMVADEVTKQKEKAMQDITNLAERLEEYAETQEALNLVGKIYEILSPEAEPESQRAQIRITWLLELLQERFNEVFGFLEGNLLELEERLTRARDALPCYRDMPCEQALDLAIAMHKEKRGAKSLEETTARDHFGGQCRKTPACRILSDLHSVGLGKWLDDDEEFSKAEKEFLKMKEGAGS
jgi:hypothetical protein